jgi:hypothetical protein
MKTLSRNWWKLLLVALIALMARVLMLQLLPLSPTFELPLSSISQTIGMIPTAAAVITVSYLVITVILLYVQEGVPGGRLTRAVACALSFSAFWFVGVLETVPALGKPLAPEIVVGLADIVPVIILGVLASVWTSGDTHSRQTRSLLRSVSIVAIVALMYFVGRYFLYAVVRVNSGYLARGEATFAWTLAMGLAVGVMYALLRGGVKGKGPWQRGLWFGVVVFGIIWALFNFFMPIVFDMSFIDFDPPILNYVWRVAVDILCVIVGVWIVESVETKEQASAG